MIETIRLKKGIQEDYTIEVQDVNGKTIDLTPYDAVSFLMVDNNWQIKVDSAWEFVVKEEWTITYKFLPADVDTTWVFKAYFVLWTWWVKKLATPADYFKVNILDDLRPIV